MNSIYDGTLDGRQQLHPRLRLRRPEQEQSLRRHPVRGERHHPQHRRVQLLQQHRHHGLLPDLADHPVQRRQPGEHEPDTSTTTCSPEGTTACTLPAHQATPPRTPPSTTTCSPASTSALARAAAPTSPGHSEPSTTGRRARTPPQATPGTTPAPQPARDTPSFCGAQAAPRWSVLSARR